MQGLIEGFEAVNAEFDNIGVSPKDPAYMTTAQLRAGAADFIDAYSRRVVKE